MRGRGRVALDAAFPQPEREQREHEHRDHAGTDERSRVLREHPALFEADLGHGNDERESGRRRQLERQPVDPGESDPAPGRRVLRSPWHNRRMPGRRTAQLALAVLALAVSVAAVPASNAAPAPAKVLAPSFAAIDAATGQVLAARRANVRRPIASLTKVMTALTAIEHGNLEGRVVVTRTATQVEPYVEGLVPGRAYKRETLLWSALLASSNDSATALAIDTGGGSLAGFYTLANARARALGMTSTTYASASGLDDVANLSTALDQAVLARAALQNPTFARIVSSRTHWTKWAAPTHAKLWVNHNKMLATTPGTYGVKTGWTSRAGGCLIVAVRRSDRAVIGVVLDSPSIWSDMATLLDMAFERLG